MIKILVTAFLWMLQTSIYNYKVTSINGAEIDFNDFRNKKVLLVNIATQSAYASQIQKLQQLYDAYKSNLVIVAFPSNSFGHEPGSNATIESFCRQQNGVQFLLASKDQVNGSAVQPVYQWLTKFSENGIMDGAVAGDFQKFLINEQGQLVGVFGPTVDPMSDQIVDAVK